MKKTKPKLLVDWCSHEAAKFACENWHYSKVVPVNKMTKVGAWENGAFIGCVLFSPGASAYSGRRYGLNKQEVCELTRVALKAHKTPVSKILAIALRFLKDKCPGIKLVISYADPGHGHHGGIYQATNWLYHGLTEPGGDYEYFVNGKWTHPRTVKEMFGYKGKALMAKGFKVRKPTNKHRYLYPFDQALRERLSVLNKPYPKRATSKDNVASTDQVEEGGAIPTVALQTSSGKLNHG